MSGFFILMKVRGAAGTHYFILITSACLQFGIFDAHCRHVIFGRIR
ncbi:hypothetical protein HX037_10035 [Ignatzschineria indica]|nr:hypothetical protein [Ignatzschineria indica]MDM1546204.1 hypothetical protein [Ignatzschineria indica]